MTLPQSLAADAEILRESLRLDLRGFTVDYRMERGDWPTHWRGRTGSACVYGESAGAVIRALAERGAG